MSGLTVLGALHHDVVVDAPGLPRVDETLVGQGADYRFGGKGGNQAVAAARMGAKVSMLGRVGRDTTGQLMLAALDAAGVERGGVTKVDAATGMSVAITQPDGSYGAVIVSGANLANDGALPPGPPPKVALVQNEVPAAANQRFALGLPEDSNGTDAIQARSTGVPVMGLRFAEGINSMMSLLSLPLKATLVAVGNLLLLPPRRLNKSFLYSPR